MKVYAITEADYDYYAIVAVFSTEALAKEYLAKYEKVATGAGIDEFEVDTSNDLGAQAGFEIYLEKNPKMDSNWPGLRTRPMMVSEESQSSWVPGTDTVRLLVIARGEREALRKVLAWRKRIVKNNLWGTDRALRQLNERH